MSQDNRLLRIKQKLEEDEKRRLSPHATLNIQGIRRAREELVGHRQAFAVDCDRILHSKAYTRYIDKTQVFYLEPNDHITHRVLHVQLVSKIGRTIGRFLGLNEDLIEAIALGHDIGHPPFGHDGETILQKISSSYGLERFQHNLQSVRALEHLERQGKGLNLTLQVLDGILCHDGEIHQQSLKPSGPRSFSEFDAKIARKSADPKEPLIPMTLEGCVVRMADTIAYIGRDIEDAIVLGVIKREDIPPSCAKTLGKTNGTIVYRLVTDLIDCSYRQGAISFSPSISELLKKLKDFNYQKIYLSPSIKRGLNSIENCYQVLFGRYIDILESGDSSLPLYRDILNTKENLERAPKLSSIEKALIVRDFIAGMTDAFFIAQAQKEGCNVPSKK